MSYYYLTATLPLLAIDEPPPMTSKAFLDLCREHLTRADADRLERLLSGDPATGRAAKSFVGRWQARENQLRNAAARVRASRSRGEAGPFLHAHDGIDATLDKAVAEALGKDSPLERETSLDRLRWNGIEELAGTDPFSVEAVLAYALKLRLAERWSAMSEDKGRDRVRQLLEDRMAAPNESKESKS